MEFRDKYLRLRFWILSQAEKLLLSRRKLAVIISGIILLVSLTSGWNALSANGAAPIAAARQLPGELSLDEAQAIAQALWQEQVAAGHASDWVDARLEDGEPLVDLQGVIIAYLFPLISSQASAEPAGYILVSNLYDATPGVVEFTTSGIPPIGPVAAGRARAAAQAAGGQLLSERGVFFGPLEYAYELSPQGEGYILPGRQFYDIRSGTIDAMPPAVEHTLKASLEERRARPAPARRLPNPSTERPGSSYPYHRIDGVPAWTQFQTGGCLSGCLPTSVAQVMGYWDNFGQFSNLIDGDNWQAAVISIRSLMGTSCKGNTGWTTIDDSKAEKYPQSRGYAFTATLDPDPSFQATYAEIDADRPVVTNISNWDGGTWKGNHSVAGIGYDGDFLIVIDNDPNKHGKEINLSTHDLSYIGVMSFCPPGQNCNPQPPSLVCPQSGGVLLYKQANFDCNNEGPEIGYTRAESSGLYNLSAALNDRVTSLRIPDGGSVTLYEHNNGQGGAYCATAPGLSDFQGRSFDNGAGLSGNVSSFRVFTNPDCHASTPSGTIDNTPPIGSYTNPASGSTVGRVVTLAANASDDRSGVTKLQFGGLWSGEWHLLGEDVQPPYEMSWDLCAAGVPDGEIKLGLKIYDRAGNLYQIQADQLPVIYAG